MKNSSGVSYALTTDIGGDVDLSTCVKTTGAQTISWDLSGIIPPNEGILNIINDMGYKNILQGMIFLKATNKKGVVGKIGKATPIIPNAINTIPNPKYKYLIFLSFLL